MEAHKFTVSRLHKYNQAATLSDYISWKYEDPPNSDKWKSFSLLNNFELEDHFKVSCVISIMLQDCDGSLDLSKIGINIAIIRKKKF